MTDYILKEDVLMALTGDITDCTIEEFIARLRDKLVKLPVKELPKAEVSLVNDSQDLVKDLDKDKWKDYEIVYRQGGYSCAVGTCPKCGTRQEVDRYCSHCGERLEVENEPDTP